MNLFAQHAAGLSQIQAILGKDCPVLVWGDVNYPVVPGSAAMKHDLTVGGQSRIYDLEIQGVLVKPFLTEALTTPQQVKDAMLETFMQYLGDAYKCIDVTILTGGLQLTLGLNSADEGA